MEEKDQDQLFEEIIDGSELREWYDKQHPHQLTIGDVYEGAAILSALQVEIHNYLREVIRTIYENNKAGEVIEQMPQLSSKQVASLMSIFENSAAFLEQYTE